MIKLGKGLFGSPFPLSGNTNQKKSLKFIQRSSSVFPQIYFLIWAALFPNHLPFNTGADLAAYRKRFLKCSKFRKPRPSLFRSLTFRLIDSIGVHGKLILHICPCCPVTGNRLVSFDRLPQLIRNSILVKPANAPQAASGLARTPFLMQGNQANQWRFPCPEHRFPKFRNGGFSKQEYSLVRHVFVWSCFEKVFQIILWVQTVCSGGFKIWGIFSVVYDVSLDNSVYTM